MLLFHYRREVVKFMMEVSIQKCFFPIFLASPRLWRTCRLSDCKEWVCLEMSNNAGNFGANIGGMDPGKIWVDHPSTIEGDEIYKAGLNLVPKINCMLVLLLFSFSLRNNKACVLERGFSVCWVCWIENTFSPYQSHLDRIVYGNRGITSAV
jgi:hypothetical protein